jgi:hypothetical protein
MFQNAPRIKRRLVQTMRRKEKILMKEKIAMLLKLI